MGRYLKLVLVALISLAVFATAGPWSLAAKKDPKRAKTTEDILDLDKDPGYYFLLGEQAETRGDMQAVFHYYGKALALDPTSAYLYLRLANLMLRNRRASDALIMARMAEIYDPKSAETYTLLGKIFRVTGDQTRALESYQKALEIKPDDKDLYVFVGHMQASEKLFADAEKTFANMVKRFPDDREGYFYLGKVYVETQQYDKAIETFKDLLERGPSGASQIHLELGTVYSLKADYEKAEQQFREAAKLDPFNINARLSLGQILAAQKKFDESYEVFEELSKLATSNIGIRIRMALILAERKQYDKAEEILNKILEARPGWDQVHQVRFHLGRVLREQGKIDEAEKEFSQIPKGSPTFLNSRVVMTLMFLKTRDLGKSMRYIDQAIDADRKDPELHQIRASILEELHRYDEAIKAFKEAMELSDKNIRIRYALGNVYEKSGRRSLGLKEMESVIAEKQDDAGALNFIGYTLLITGKDLDRAESLIRKASELKPEDGYIMDSMGWMLHKKGKDEEALTYLQKASDRAKYDPIIADHLGDVLRALGKTKEAAEAYQKSLTLNPDNLLVQAKLKEVESQLKQQEK